MTNRRDFIRKFSIALAGGLILGPEALEACARLTHTRKSFPSAGIPDVTIHRPTLIDLYKRARDKGQFVAHIEHLMQHSPLLADIPWKMT